MKKGTTVNERREAIRARNPAWVQRTLAQHLARQAKDYPDRPFLMTDTESHSYSETLAWVRRIAKGLMAMGVVRGDHVAMIMANYPELIVLRFALAALGAVGVPVNTLLKGRELAYIVRQSDAKFVVTMDTFREQDHLALLDEISPGWESGPFPNFPVLRGVLVFRTGEGKTRAGARDFLELEKLGQSVSDADLDARIAAVQPGDLLDIVYTSGTTGLPKGVMLTHDGVLRCSFTASLARALHDGQRLMLALPLYHSYAYIEGLMTASWVAGSLVMHTKFDPEAIMAAVDRLKVNELLLVPTMSIALLEHPRLKSYSFESLTAVMSAAAQAPVTLWGQICEAFGVDEVTTAYGQTELSSSAAYKRPEDPLELLSTTVGRLKPRSVAGTAETDGRVAVYRVVDPVTGADIPDGTPGEFIARGPEMMLGYYNKPEETAAVFRSDGWMRTGDLGYINPEGMIVLTGRSKELYKCGGELVAPKEIEDLLTTRPDVSQAYVVGIPDKRMSEVGCAFVVAAPHTQPSAEELREFCAANLGRFKVPRHVLVVSAESLPVTATGKVQKFLLRDIAVAQLTANGTLTAV